MDFLWILHNLKITEIPLSGLMILFHFYRTKSSHSSLFLFFTFHWQTSICGHRVLWLDWRLGGGRGQREGGDVGDSRGEDLLITSGDCVPGCQLYGHCLACTGND